jgi:uncharacterized SAM-binding protein YcdF (DUF218 family)
MDNSASGELLQGISVQDFLRGLIAIPMPFMVLGTAGLILWRWRRTSRALLAASAAGLLLTSLPVTGKLLLMPLRSMVQEWAPDGEPVDAILVPTAGIYYDGNGRWWASAGSVRRLAGALAARETLKGTNRQPIPIVISGGRTKTDGPAEAAVLVKQFNLSGPGVILETAALNSHQTAVNLERQLRALGIRRLVVFTNVWHMARMAGVLRHEGFDVRGVTDYGESHAESDHNKYGILDFLPQPSGFRLSAWSTNALAGILWYFIAGRLSPGDLSPGR